MDLTVYLAVVTATIQGLNQLRTAEVISAIRGEEVRGLSMVSSTVLLTPAEDVASSGNSNETTAPDTQN